MAKRPEDREPPRTLGDHFRYAAQQRRAWRPVSFYVLLAIPLVLIFAVPAFYHPDDPTKFALHLILLFVFLFVMLLCAVVDVAEIAKRHLKERRATWQETLGEEEFVDKLAQHTTKDKPIK